MIKFRYFAFVLFFVLSGLLINSNLSCEEYNAQDIIEKILAVEAVQKEKLKDIVIDAEMLEGEIKDGKFVEKSKFLKKVYIKFLPDTTLMVEKYLEYYKEGEKQSEKKMNDEVKKKLEKKKKRKAKDISNSMYKPFYEEMKDIYEIEFKGLKKEKVNGYSCFEFKVKSKIKDSEHINGSFFFDSKSYNLVRVEFVPAKLVKKLMFKLKKLDMVLNFQETDAGFWIAEKFEIDGQGKAAIFIGVKFAVEETYSNPIFNSGLDDKIFEVNDGK